MSGNKIANLGSQEVKGNARRVRYLLPATCYLKLLFAACSLLAVHAQESRGGQDFFVGAFGEAVGYGYDGVAYGGGLIIGAGSGGALGLRVLYALDDIDITFLEVTVFARLYIFGRDAFSGPFVQLNAGPVIYLHSDIDQKGYGNISAGLSTGWRFLLGKRFFAEPTLRIGYPYLLGGTIAVGFRTGSR